jgi:hypothetical protein
LARLCSTHTAWMTRFLAVPIVLGIADSDRIALIYPIREGRSPAQIGTKGQSNYQWIIDGQLCFILNQWELFCAWDCATANVHDTHFQPLIAQVEGQMIVLTDTDFHAQIGDPTICESVRVAPGIRRCWWKLCCRGSPRFFIARKWAIACGPPAVPASRGLGRRAIFWPGGDWQSMTRTWFVCLLPNSVSHRLTPLITSKSPSISASPRGGCSRQPHLMSRPCASNLSTAAWFLLRVALAGLHWEKPHSSARINTGMAEPFRVSPPEAVAYPLE